MFCIWLMTPLWSSALFLKMYHLSDFVHNLKTFISIFYMNLPDALSNWNAIKFIQKLSRERIDCIIGKWIPFLWLKKISSEKKDRNKWSLPHFIFISQFDGWLIISNIPSFIFQSITLSIAGKCHSYIFTFPYQFIF